MFLSGDWLRNNGSGLVTPFDENQIDGAAYTLKVGGEAYISPEAGQRGNPEIRRLYITQSLAIPPGQFAFLLTSEEVSVPYDLLALINIKNGLKVQGLVNVRVGFETHDWRASRLTRSMTEAA
ncbi:dCTP deaminase domain-containing protein [Pelagibacterium montanilacus]|uniref:dCTP deaminase domain-containing protein n=1 Tax=Pelagibacterium montanilacus TaxID=2185280 RepID=UPI003CCC7930